MKPLICCEIGPNYTISDAKVALNSRILRQSDQKLGELENQVVSSLQKIVNPSCKFYFTDSGRTGLTLLLRSLDLPEASEIIIQSYSCIVVPNSVLQAGLIPVIVDVDQSSYGMNYEELQAKITSKTRVIIIQYNYGLTQDVTKIVELCRLQNIIIIEDCAHALGTEVLLNGSYFPAGSIGEAAFFSFGRDKIVSSTMGGVVTFGKNTDEKWRQNFETKLQKLPVMPTKTVNSCIDSVWLFALLIRPFYHLGVGKFKVGKGLMAFCKSFGFIPSVYTNEEKIGTSHFTGYQFNKKLFPIVDGQLKKLETTSRHRKKIAKIYSEKLGIEYSNISAYLRFPVVLRNGGRENWGKVVNKLSKLGMVVSATWYDGVFTPNSCDLDLFNYTKGSCKNAEEISNYKMLNLPTNIHVTTKQAENIAEIILGFGSGQIY